MITGDVEIYKEGETGPSGESGLYLYVIPLAVQFKLAVSSGVPVSFLWDFGDGETSVLQEPVHTYSNSGTYRVVLTVFDSDGQYVMPFFYLKLGSLDFSADVVRGMSPLTVSFTNSFVTPTGCSFTGAIWDFGDGTTGMVEDPTHVYSENGKYTIKIDAFLKDS